MYFSRSEVRNVGGFALWTVASQAAIVIEMELCRCSEFEGQARPSRAIDWCMINGAMK